MIKINGTEFKDLSSREQIIWTILFPFIIIVILALIPIISALAIPVLIISATLAWIYMIIITTTGALK